MQQFVHQNSSLAEGVVVALLGSREKRCAQENGIANRVLRSLENCGIACSDNARKGAGGLFGAKVGAICWTDCDPLAPGLALKKFSFAASFSRVCCVRCCVAVRIF